MALLCDIAAHLLRICAHPAFPADSRVLIGPVARGLEHLARQQVGALDVHRIHAKYAGTEAAGIWKVAQLSQRLDSEDQRITSDLIKETFQQYRKNYNSALLKEQSKAEAQKSARDQSGRGRGNRGRGQRGGRGYRGRGSGGAGPSGPSE